MTLTGMETWAIIAPVLAAEMVTKHDITQDAYITTFHALKEYDKRIHEPKITEALLILAKYMEKCHSTILTVDYKDMGRMECKFYPAQNRGGGKE